MKRNGLTRWLVGVAVCCVLQSTPVRTQVRPEGNARDRPLEVTYRVQEGQPAGSRVAQLSADARLSLLSQYGPGELSSLTYFLSKESQYFQLDTSTSVISVKQPIDREALIRMFLENHADAKTTHGIFCATANGSQSTVYSQLECRFSLLAGIRSGNSNVKWVTLHVTVADVNDNAPSWYNIRWLNISIPEQVPTGYCARLTPAVDQDYLHNGTVYYAVSLAVVQTQRGAAPFELRQGPSADELCVRVVSALDREAKDQYQLTLVARDGGSPAQNTSVVLNIYIADDNDNAPRFNSSHEVRHVSEAAQFQTVVYTAAAFDNDVSDRAKLRYSLAASQDAYYCEHAFRIDPESGDVTVDGVLDRETRTACHVQISVSDGKFTGEQALTIQIDDVNDNAPRIEIIQLPDASRPTPPAGDLLVPTFEIVEHSPNNRMVVHVDVTDADDGNNGLISCTLDNGEQFRLDAHKNDTRNAITYTLSSTHLFDRELRAAYELSIRCRDAGEPPLLSRKNVTVRIADINDHAPTFDKNEYIEHVRENNMDNHIVLFVQATDEDSGENARIEYVLNKTNLPRDVHVELHRETGELRVSSKLDRERHGKNLTFEVIARDFGTPRRSSSVPVTFIIDDVNDHAPKFTNAQYRFEVREDAVAYTEVGRVLATDSDADAPNCDVAYSLQRQVPHSNTQSHTVLDLDMFTVNAAGVIELTGKLDYERVQSYTLHVVARDLSINQPQQSAFASVQVDVRDVNDNKPRWHFPSEKLKVQNVSCHEPMGKAITQLSAADEDSEENANLLYSISHIAVNGQPSGDAYLAVNDITGQVSVAKALPCPGGSNDAVIIKLVVNATDRGQFPQWTASVMDLFVRNMPPSDSVVGASGSARSESNTLPFNLTDQSVIVVLCAVLATLFTALVLVIVAACYKLRKPRDDEEDDERPYTAEQTRQRSSKNPTWTDSAVYADAEQLCQRQAMSKRFATLGSLGPQRDLPSRPNWNSGPGSGSGSASTMPSHAREQTKDSPCSLWRQVEIVSPSDAPRCRHISEETEDNDNSDSQYDANTVRLDVAQSSKCVIDLVPERTSDTSDVSPCNTLDCVTPSPRELASFRPDQHHRLLGVSRSLVQSPETPAKADANVPLRNDVLGLAQAKKTSGVNDEQLLARNVRSASNSAARNPPGTPRSTSMHCSRAANAPAHKSWQKFSPAALHLTLPQSLRKASSGSVSSTRSSLSDTATAAPASLARSVVLADAKTTRMRIYEAQSFKPVQQHQAASGQNQTSTFV